MFVFYWYREEHQETIYRMISVVLLAAAESHTGTFSILTQDHCHGVLTDHSECCCHSLKQDQEIKSSLQCWDHFTASQCANKYKFIYYYCLQGITQFGTKIHMWFTVIVWTFSQMFRERPAYCTQGQNKAGQAAFSFQRSLGPPQHFTLLNQGSKHFCCI